MTPIVLPAGSNRLELSFPNAGVPPRAYKDLAGSRYHTVLNLIRSAQSLELGATDWQRLGQGFLPWLSATEPTRSPDLALGEPWINLLNLSPLRHSFYGSPPPTHLVMIQDAREAPVHEVVRFVLTPQESSVWVRTLRQQSPF